MVDTTRPTTEYADSTPCWRGAAGNVIGQNLVGEPAIGRRVLAQRCAERESQGRVRNRQSFVAEQGRAAQIPRKGRHRIGSTL
jgi:hypothetical protein